MILSDSRILEEMEKGTIVVTPYNRDCLGSNSYDVHLGKYLALYIDSELDIVEEVISKVLLIPLTFFVN